MTRIIFSLIVTALIVSCNKASVVENIDPSLLTDSVTVKQVPKIQRKGAFRVENVWKQTYLCISSNAVAVLNAPNSYWVVESIRDSTGFCIRDSASGYYLIDNGTGKPGPASDYANYNSFWIFHNINTGQPDTTFNPAVAYQISNTRTGGYINIESGPVASGGIQPGWLSAQWQFIK